MAELKVKKHITYTYETSDGCCFDNKKEATEWQNHLSNIETMRMLDSDYEPTKDICGAIYVCAETKDQADAFNVIQEKALGYCSTIDGVGHYRYDEISDRYIRVESEIEKLQHIIDTLESR